MRSRLASSGAAYVGRTLRVGAILGLAVLLPGVMATAPVDAAKVVGIVVDDTGSAIGDPLPFGKCGAPNYTTITEAVTFANANFPTFPVILVCAGNYPESNISVDEPLRILGAQWGKDARNGRTNVSKESVLNHDGGGAGFYLDEDDIIIDGFTIQKVSGPAGGSGIQTDDGDSGYQILNNIFSRHEIDLELGTDDNDNQTVVRRNRFTSPASNASPPPDPSASGVGISNGTAAVNDVLIEMNRFTLHRLEAIRLDGNAGPVADNVTIQNNQFVLDREIRLEIATNVNILNNLISSGREAGIISTGSTDVLIKGNTIERNKLGGLEVNNDAGATDEVEVSANTFTRNGGPGVVIVDNGGDVTVHNNTVQDNGGPGIIVSGNTHALFLIDNRVRRNGGGDTGVVMHTSTLVTVQDNDIRDNRGDGVAVLGVSSDIIIDNNDLFDNTGDGIFLDTDATSVTLTNNVARNNVEHDCHEATVPFVNFWALSNQGETQNQPGLCNGAQTIERVR